LSSVLPLIMRPIILVRKWRGEWVLNTDIFLMTGSRNRNKSLCSIQMWFYEDCNGNSFYHFLTCFLKYEKLNNNDVIFLYFSFTGETSWGCRISWVTDVWLCNQIQWSLELIVKPNSFTRHNFHSRVCSQIPFDYIQISVLNWIENFMNVEN